MSRKLTPDEPLAAGVRRVTSEPLDECLPELDNLGRQSAAAVVHDPRRRRRSVRAMVRPAPGRKRHRQDNARLRQAGWAPVPARRSASEEHTIRCRRQRGGSARLTDRLCRRLL